MNLKISLLTAALLPAFVATACSAAPTKADRQPSSEKVAPQIYVFESDASGFNTKNFFYDNGEEVVVIDTQFTPDTAKKAIDFLRTKTKNPITHVVITHPNPDKFNGMIVFQEQGAKVVASQATVNSMPGVHAYKKFYFVNIAKMFSEETYPSLGQVDITFDRHYTIALRNGETIELAELSSPGVSSNQTIAFVSSRNAVFVGDLVHHKAHAWLEGGIVNGQPAPTLQGWLADLNELQARYKTRNPAVYGGRGEIAPLNIAVKDQLAYLTKADELVSNYVSSLGSKKGELQSAKAAEHYTALQSEFEKAFPDYELGYMIQYGVYGLVNTK